MPNARDSRTRRPETRPASRFNTGSVPLVHGSHPRRVPIPMRYCFVICRAYPNLPRGPRAPVTVSVSGRNETLSASTVLESGQTDYSGRFREVSGSVLRSVGQDMSCLGRRDMSVCPGCDGSPSLEPGMRTLMSRGRGPLPSTWQTSVLEFCCYRHVIASLGAADADAVAEPRFCRPSAPWGRRCSVETGELGRVDGARG